MWFQESKQNISNKLNEHRVKRSYLRQRAYKNIVKESPIPMVSKGFYIGGNGHYKAGAFMKYTGDDRSFPLW